MARRTTALLALALLAASCAADPVNAPTPGGTTVPGGGGKTSYEIEEVGRLDGAVDLVERDAADPFFYVVAREGTIERWSRDGSSRLPVLDISPLTTTDSERGLLGLDFRRAGGAWEAFLSYTNTSGNTVISRLAVRDDGTFDTAGTPGGATVITIDQPYANHNGGDIEVGPDAMLYVALGDGGSAGDPERRALDTGELLGKILRINPTAGGYEVPADNPFTGVDGARPEIWSLGLRNPWRVTFDGAGNLWVADVGQSEWEEVNLATADGAVPGGRGASFGWSAWEGTHRYNEDVSAPGATEPVHEYPHDDGRCSISGGAVGTERATPGRAGWYFFGDYCAGKVWAILVADGTTQAKDTVASGLGDIVAVRAVDSGVYVLSDGGRVSRIVSAARP